MNTPTVSTMNKTPEIPAFGFIVHFHFKPNWHEAMKREEINFLPTMFREPTLRSYFRLQNHSNPSRVRLFEAWDCTKEEFMSVEMKRSYRDAYEKLLPNIVVEPREMQMDWKLVKCRSHPLTQDGLRSDTFGFFVYFDVKPGKEQEFRNYLDPVLDTMSDEEDFLNYYLLQDRTVSTKFVIYETWRGNQKDFADTHIKRPYRQPYEAALPELLAKPRDIQFDWDLVLAEDRGVGNK